MEAIQLNLFDLLPGFASAGIEDDEREKRDPRDYDTTGLKFERRDDGTMQTEDGAVRLLSSGRVVRGLSDAEFEKWRRDNMCAHDRFRRYCEICKEVTP